MATKTEAELAQEVTDLTAKLATAEAAATAALAKAATAEAELAKTRAPDDRAEIEKALPEPIRKELDELRKTNEAAAERIAKLENDRELNSMIAKARDYGALGKQDDLGGLLLTLKRKLTADDFTAFLAKMAGWQAQVTQARAILTKTLGHDGADADSPAGRLQALAKKYEADHANEAGMTYEIAYAKVLQSAEGKELYKTMQATERGN